jgi:type IV pilus assembly protein PilF
VRRRALLVLATLLVVPGCSPKMEKPPPENPVLADLVDYRAGLTLLREGRADEAISVLSRARQSNPADPNVPNALGLALLYKKDYTGAVKAFGDALRLKPDFLDARNNRGVAYLQMDRFEDAERDFQAVLDGPQSPDRANAYFNLGLVYQKKAQWRDAEREFSLAIADSPLMLRAFRERGLARVQLENFREALEDFLIVLKEEPKDVTANYNAALCLLAVGRRDLAFRYMERAATAAPESDDGRKARRFLDAERYRPGDTP